MCYNVNETLNVQIVNTKENNADTGRWLAVINIYLPNNNDIILLLLSFTIIVIIINTNFTGRIKILLLYCKQSIMLK